jgi:C4-dicarboxylate-specific signal transduction histidine kinase
MDRTLVPLDALRSLARPGLAPRDARSALATVDEVVAGMTPLASEAGVDLRLSASRGGRARVDAEYLRIILDNLLANALEGRGDGARARRVHVTVSEESLQAKGARVTITVSDDGPGLDGERARSLFEPLRTDKVGGLGLGLPIARALARTMGGELTKADVPGFMTSFVLELPSEPIA